MHLPYLFPAPRVKSTKAENLRLKEETHAARWGLLRGYSGKATKWVDFVVTDSTRRESCHSLRVVRNEHCVKGEFATVSYHIRSVPCLSSIDMMAQVQSP
jgi:hypothetical protein